MLCGVYCYVVLFILDVSICGVVWGGWFAAIGAVLWVCCGVVGLDCYGCSCSVLFGFG